MEMLCLQYNKYKIPTVLTCIRSAIPKQKLSVQQKKEEREFVYCRNNDICI